MLPSLLQLMRLLCRCGMSSGLQSKSLKAYKPMAMQVTMTSLRISQKMLLTSMLGLASGIVALAIRGPCHTYQEIWRLIEYCQTCSQMRA